MTVFFSKTQHITLDHWEVTIAPDCIKKGYIPQKGDVYSDEESVSMVCYPPVKNTVVVRTLRGIPCVGRGYILEKQ